MTIALVATATNDLVVTFRASGIEFQRFDSPDDALHGTHDNDVILVLAPVGIEEPIRLSDEFVSAAKAKKRAVYAEMAILGDEAYPEIHHARFERGVVTSDEFGNSLEKMRIIAMHGTAYYSLSTPSPMVVQARVAGFDTALYGLPINYSPVLAFDADNGMYRASACLSNFITGRYAPAAAWKTIWETLLEHLTGTHYDLLWTPSVAPSYTLQDQIGEEELLNSIRRGTSWVQNARLFMTDTWKGHYEVGSLGEPDGVAPAPILQNLPCGDGSLGMIEGVNSAIDAYGNQNYRYVLRADCMGEMSFLLALAGTHFEATDCQMQSLNLHEYLFETSNFAKGPRADVNSPTYGLVAWMGNDVNGGVYYGDDNARMLLGTLAAASILNSDRFRPAMARCLLANLRTTGPEGFRGERLEDGDIQKNGWKFYRDHHRTFFAPHFEAYLWACYLAAYAASEFQPFLECAKRGIYAMMAAYPDDWHWTNGMQQERARMILPLAWLLRIENTPQHRLFLDKMTSELLRFQDPCGAIREEIGAAGKGTFGPCADNESYGTTEAPLIQTNDDRLSDLLYTTNFAFIGLHEAAMATGNAELTAATKRLADFLVRIQVRSRDHEDLDGAWFRAFDFKRWEYWASNADSGWGAWSIESGWTQSWVAGTLLLHLENRSLWDFVADPALKPHIDRYAPIMWTRE